MKSVAEEIGYTVEYITHTLIRIKNLATPGMLSDISSMMFYNASKDAISEAFTNIFRWLCINSRNPNYNTELVSAFVTNDVDGIEQLLNQDVRTVINHCTGFVDCHGEEIYVNDTVVEHCVGNHIYSKVVFENGAYGIRRIGEDHIDDAPEYFCNIGRHDIEKYIVIVRE